MKPFFSIIIPTLNEEDFLPRLLSSLSRQKDKDFEVIIADAFSSDSTREKAHQFSDKLDLRFKQISKENVSRQKNSGAKLAGGKYLIFIDADSNVGSAFTQQLKRFIKIKHGLIFLPYVDPDEKSKDVKAFYQVVNFLIDISQNINKPLSSVGCMIFERNVFGLIGGFDEKLYVGEDFSIIHKAQKWGIKARFMPNVKIKFSFRRIKKEGRLKSLYKLLTGTFHVLFKGDIKEKIFEHEMGGQIYKDYKKDSKSYMKKIKDFFE